MVDTYTISYVGKMDWGGLAEHIRGIYNITDNSLMLEVNALPDKFCICFEMYPKSWTRSTPSARYWRRKSCPTPRLGR